MANITLRVPDELAGRLKAAAASAGASLNRWAASILEAAVDPETASSERERIRERLRRAGLLAEPPRMKGRGPSEEEVARARRAAAKGTSLSDYVIEDRRR